MECLSLSCVIVHMSSSELFTKTGWRCHKVSNPDRTVSMWTPLSFCVHISHHDDEYSTNLSKHFTLRLSKKLGSL